MDTPRPLPVYLLAGGKSSRFGSDKARALLDNQPLIVRLADALKPIATALTVVADRPGKYADLNLHTIADVHANLGPLAGLHAALRHAAEHHPDQPWLLLTSCDLLEIRPAWIAQLQAHAEPDRLGVAFKSDRWHPLPGLYHHDLLPHVERQLHSRQRALRQLLDAVPAAAVPMPADWPAIAQANTPQDLQQHRRLRHKPQQNG